MTLEDRITQENDKDPEDNVMPTDGELKAIDIVAGFIYHNVDAYKTMAECNKLATRLVHKLQDGFIIVDREGLDNRLAEWLRNYFYAIVDETPLLMDRPFSVDADELMKVLYGD